MTKHEYICQITETVKLRSSCLKRKVGAVFINTDFEILVTGYNEAPKGFPHCNEGTCGNPCTNTIHAEQNAIVQAAKRNISLKNSILYCTYLPCIICARLLINLEVRGVYIKEFSKELDGLYILEKANIPVIEWK